MKHTNDLNPSSLTIGDLGKALAQRGFHIAPTSFSEFLNTGDIKEQLHIGGHGTRAAVPPDAVDTLATFWPLYERNGKKRAEAPELLRAFLWQQNQTTVDNAPLPTITEASAVSEAAAIEIPPFVALLAREWAWAATECLLNAEEAAALVGATVEELRQYGPIPFKRYGNIEAGDRWRRSDLLRKVDQGSS